MSDNHNGMVFVRLNKRSSSRCWNLRWVCWESIYQYPTSLTKRKALSWRALLRRKSQQQELCRCEIECGHRWGNQRHGSLNAGFSVLYVQYPRQNVAVGEWNCWLWKLSPVIAVWNLKAVKTNITKPPNGWIQRSWSPAAIMIAIKKLTKNGKESCHSCVICNSPRLSVVSGMLTMPSCHQDNLMSLRT